MGTQTLKPKQTDLSYAFYANFVKFKGTEELKARIIRLKYTTKKV